MKQVWQTEDGSVFQSQAEAVAYEEKAVERKKEEEKLGKFQDIIGEVIDILLEDCTYEHEEFGTQVIFSPSGCIAAAKYLINTFDSGKEKEDDAV